MKYSFLGLLCCFLVVFAQAQKKSKKKPENTVYSARLNVVPIRTADENGTFTFQYYSHVTGRLILWETCADSAGTILHGLRGYYDAEGHLDSLGTIIAGQRDGLWYYFDHYNLRSDSLTKVKLYEEGILKKEFVNTATKTIIELPKAEVKEWGEYVTEHMRYPKEAMDLGIYGRVTILAMVDTDSTVIGFIPLDSKGPVLDHATLKLAKKLKVERHGALNKIPSALPVLLNVTYAKPME